MDEISLGKILEMLSRVLGSLDGIRRSIDNLEESLNTLAITIYASCATEKFENAKIIRSGLPSGVSFLIELKDKIYAARTRIVSTYEDAIKIREIVERFFPKVEGKEIIPMLITSKYKSHDVPSDVDILIC